MGCCMNNGITVVSGIVNRIPAFYDDRVQVYAFGETDSDACHGVGRTRFKRTLLILICLYVLSFISYANGLVRQ